MRRLCLWLVWATAALAQSPEIGRVERDGSQATLIVDSRRPLDSAAITIAEQFRVPVSTEDPPYLYRDDVKDVTGEVARVRNPARRILAPKGGQLEVESANLMAAELSAQTGLRVSCCQGGIAGIPWGMMEVSFEAHHEPARSVLKRLIVSSLPLQGGAGGSACVLPQKVVPLEFPKRSTQAVNRNFLSHAGLTRREQRAVASSGLSRAAGLTHPFRRHRANS